MSKYTVAVTDYGFPDLKQEEAVLIPEGFRIRSAQSRTAEEVIALARDADAIMSDKAPVTKEVIDRLRNCKVIVRYGVGVDNIDIEAARARNIPVVNVPDYNTGEVADHAMTLLLSSVRKITQIVAQVRNGVWDMTPCRPIQGLQDKVLGIVGFGHIGRDVARRAQSFGMRTIAFDPFVQDEVYERMNTGKTDWRTLLQESDFISIHLPLLPSTRHLFDDEAFSLMKPTAYVVNTSRGAVIRTESLIRALRENRIAGAGIDVCEEEPVPPDSPLLGMAQCLVTSHCAWYSESSLNRLQRYAAMEIVRLFRGERPKHIVNGVQVGHDPK